MSDLGDSPFMTQAQDIVAIIEPASRFGRGADFVTIITTAVVDGDVVQLTERRAVEEDGDEFRLHLDVPIRGTDLSKDAPWSAAVLLPRATAEFAVEIRVEGDVDGELLTPDAENPRQIAIWHGLQDPGLDVIWKYINSIL